MKPLSRRTLLRGMLSTAPVCLALPWLEAMARPAWACGGAIPKRFGLFFWGNGNLPDRWTPEGVGVDWQLSDQLQPLARHKDKLTVVSGTSLKVPNIFPHGSGAAGVLTSAAIDSDGETYLAPTIDQIIAAEVGNDTAFRSLQTASTNYVGLSFNGPGSRNPAETDPYNLFGRLFGSTFVAPGSDGIVDPRLGLRRSVLDAVMGDVESLNGKLGQPDKDRLDQHLTGLRELEQRLAKLEEDPPNLESCERAAEPLASYPDVDGRPQLAARTEAMAQMLAMSFACDQTRVLAHFLSAPINDVLFDEVSAGHHDLTHNEPGDQPQVHEITLQCMEHFATFIDAFRAIPEEDGTLLDNCVLLGTSEISLGKTHSLDEMPLLLAGGCCGALKTDYHYRSLAQENTAKAMLSVIRAMDVNLGSYGTDDAATTSSLTDIEQ